MQKEFLIIFLLVAYIAFPLNVFAAEVLQISSSSLIQVGDNNRVYKVKLACINVSPNRESLAVESLRKQLPRRTKINLMPRGSKDGTLLAKVIVVKSNLDISQSLSEKGIADYTC